MDWRTLTAAQKREAVMALRREGLSHSRIAERLGAPSRASVSNVAQRAKTIGPLPRAAGTKPLRKVDWDQAALQEAARLWNKDWTTSRIAAELKVSRNAIVGIAARNRDLFPARPNAKGGRVAKPVIRPVVSPTPAKPKACPPETSVQPPGGKRQRSKPSSRRRSPAGKRASRPDPPTASPARRIPVRTKEDPALRIDRQHAFEPLPGCEPVNMVDISQTQCRWPVNGFDGGEPVFCGRGCERAEPYCAEHRRIACRMG